MTFLFVYYSTLSHHFEFLVHAEEWGLQSYQAYRGHHNHNTPYCPPELHEAALCRLQPPSQTGDQTDRLSYSISHFWSDFLFFWLPKGESRLLQVLSAEPLLFILFFIGLLIPGHASRRGADLEEGEGETLPPHSKICLCPSITAQSRVWFPSCTVAERKALQRVVTEDHLSPPCKSFTVPAAS